MVTVYRSLVASVRSLLFGLWCVRRRRFTSLVIKSQWCSPCGMSDTAGLRRVLYGYDCCDRWIPLFVFLECDVWGFLVARLWCLCIRLSRWCVSLAVAVPHYIFWSLALEFLRITLITVCFLARLVVNVYCCSWTGSLEHDALEVCHPHCVKSNITVYNVYILTYTCSQKHNN